MLTDQLPCYFLSKGPEDDRNAANVLTHVREAYSQ